MPRRPAYALTFAALLAAAPYGARAEEPAAKPCAWPVATLSLPATVGEHVRVTIAQGPETSVFTAGAEPAYLLRWDLPEGTPAPDAATARALLSRVLGLGQRPQVKVEPVEGGVLVSAGALSHHALRRELTGLRRAPRLAFRPVLRPEGSLPGMPDGTVRVGPVWSGTPAEYEAFRAAEAQRWREAAAAARPYQPSRPDLEIAPTSGHDLAQDTSFEVLGPPPTDLPLDARLLHDISVGRGARNEAVVLLDIEPALVPAFQALTGRLVGTPLGLLLDGRLVAAPLVTAELGAQVQINLGGAGQTPGASGSSEAQAKGLRDLLLRANVAPMRLVAAVDPWSAGRRAVHVLLARTGVTDVRAVAAGTEAAVELRARFAPDVPATATEVPEGLAAACSTGSLEEPWARGLAAGVPAPALLEALAGRVRDAGDDTARGEALEVLGWFGAGDPAVAVELAEAATGGPSPSSAAARQVLADGAHQTAPVFAAVLAAGAREPRARGGRAEALLTRMAAAHPESLAGTLGSKRPEERTLALGALVGLTALPPARLQELDLAPRLLADPSPRAQALGLWWRLRSMGAEPVEAPEALLLVARLHDPVLAPEIQRLFDAGLADLGAPAAQGLLAPVPSPVARALWALFAPDAFADVTESILPLSLAPLERCLRALARERVPAHRLAPADWLELLASADADARAVGAASLALVSPLPAEVRARLEEIVADATKPEPGRWLAATALAVGGGAPRPLVTAVSAGLKARADDPWAAYVRYLLLRADR